MEECREGRVRSVNTSRRKGGRKTPCAGGAAIEANRGVAGDAHAGDWHRQVSLLAWESIEKAQAMGLDVAEGDFAENVTTEGIDLLALPLGTRVRVGGALLELSHGNVVLTEITVPRMRYHSNEAGILASSVPLPENSLIAAVSPKDDDNVEVVGEETVLYPGDKAIVVADTEVLDEVRSLFKGL